MLWHSLRNLQSRIMLESRKHLLPYKLLEVCIITPLSLSSKPLLFLGQVPNIAYCFVLGKMTLLRNRSHKILDSYFSYHRMLDGFQHLLVNVPAILRNGSHESLVSSLSHHQI